MLYLNAYQLASLAGCASPDSPDSPGARFLVHVLDAVNETGVPGDPSCAAGTIADDAPHLYTAILWSEFLDLAAYEEDPTELGFDGSNMEQGARICLYIIAERLALALFEKAAEEEEEEA